MFHVMESRSGEARGGEEEHIHLFLFEAWTLIASIECKKDDYLKWFLNAQNLV